MKIAPNLSTSDIGAAGEHFVCADLFCHGIRATRATEEQFDVIFRIAGKSVHVQVRAQIAPRLATSRSKIAAYRFSFLRTTGGGGDSPRKKAEYEAGTINLYGFVALDIDRVAYILPPPKRTTGITIRVPGVYYPPMSSHTHEGHHFDDYTLEQALAALTTDDNDRR